MKMRALLVQQELEDAFGRENKLPSTLTNKEKKDIIDKAYNAIILSLDVKVLRKISKETWTY